MVLVGGPTKTELQRKWADLTDLRFVKWILKHVEICPSSFKLKRFFFFLVNEEERTKWNVVYTPEQLELGKHSNQVSRNTDQ